MRAKLGLGERRLGDDALIDELLTLLHAQNGRLHACFRALSSSLRGDAATVPIALRRARRLRRLGARVGGLGCRPRPVTHRRSREAMDRVNPVYIPRNHRVEEALAAATDGDLGPFRRLLDVLAQPFDERPGLESYAAPAPPGFGAYRTFCGT